MSVQLHEQLRTYTNAVSEAQSPVTPEEAQLLVSAVREVSRAPAATRNGLHRPALVAVAAAVAVLVLALPMLLSRSDSPPSNSSTIPSTPTTTVVDASPTTTVVTVTTLASGPSGAGLDALPPGWQVMETTIPADAGDLHLRYTQDGRPMILTIGYDCIDAQGATRIQESFQGFNQGDCLDGDVVEPAENVYVATSNGTWVQHEDPVPGRNVWVPSNARLLMHVVACQPGTILRQGEVGPDACVHLATDDGGEWFSPTLDGAEYSVEDPSMHPYGSAWARIDDTILRHHALPGNTSNGSPREPTGIAWQYSTDGGRTFTEIATEGAVYSSEWGPALSFTYQGAFRSIIWDASGTATLRQLDNDLQWQTIREVTGLPEADDAWEAGQVGRSDVIGTPTGPIYMFPIWPESEQAITHMSRDGGVTWTEPSASDLPFDTVSNLGHELGDRALWVPWIMPMGDWLMLSTDSGTYLTNGTDWYPLSENTFGGVRHGTSARDPITVRLPARTTP